MSAYMTVTSTDVFKDVIFVRYQDHVVFNRADPLMMYPQVREAVGWLVYECEHYVTLKYDMDADPPKLKCETQKASGLVVLKSNILEMKKLCVSECPLNSQVTIHNIEYALQDKEVKNSQNKKQA
ncbi:MAG: hypothetical protein FWF66_03285 [Candidatus Bathyarchaeota archaeon]|nr:hypothetical protein [Candidatus Termiticorpusculum sp.]